MGKAKLSVGIINLNVSNIFSVYEGCLKAGFKTQVIDLKKRKLNYDIIIIPGVGSFSSGMKFFNENNLADKIDEYLLKPNSFIYGICLGMQLLFDKSYEFKKTEGLHLVKGEVRKFKNIKTHITHVGWNKITLNNNDFKKHFKKFENKYFYFIHSFYANPDSKKDIFAFSKHGNRNFCSITKRKNIFGTQFHPEKSGRVGIEFLKNLKHIKN